MVATLSINRWTIRPPRRWISSDRRLTVFHTLLREIVRMPMLSINVKTKEAKPGRSAAALISILNQAHSQGISCTLGERVP